jgi:hypothetical protein
MTNTGATSPSASTRLAPGHCSGGSAPLPCGARHLAAEVSPDLGGFFIAEAALPIAAE